MEFKKYKCKIKDEICFLLDQIKSKKTKKDNNNNNKDTDNKINKIKKYIGKIKISSKMKISSYLKMKYTSLKKKNKKKRKTAKNNLLDWLIMFPTLLIKIEGNYKDKILSTLS